ncbi:hypothetical protein DOT_4875 [Desulfosporosinus sp. OT]|nr:hypothetical protein DOT_4875 [Desulfosporosinus sp. OT]
MFRSSDQRFYGSAPQVSSALKRKAGEPFATLRPHTHTPAVWILNFRVRYTKSTIVSSGDYRRATHPKETLRGEGSFSPHCVPIRILQQCGSNGWNPSPNFRSTV